MDTSDTFKKREPRKITKENVLFVEGSDDVTFFIKLLEHLSVLGNFDIIDCNGKDGIKEKVVSTTVGRDFLKLLHSNKIKSLAIVRDADDYPAKSFESILDVLKEAGFSSFPTKAFEIIEGKLENQPIKVSVVIMPDGSNPGMLEDLCLESVKEKEQMECVDKFFECLVKEKNFKVKKKKDTNEKDDEKTIKNPSKAKLQTYLSTVNIPYKIGADNNSTVPIQQKVWDFEHTAFSQIKEFLLKLNNQ